MGPVSTADAIGEQQAQPRSLVEDLPLPRSICVERNIIASAEDERQPEREQQIDRARS